MHSFPCSTTSIKFQIQILIFTTNLIEDLSIEIFEAIIKTKIGMHYTVPNRAKLNYVFPSQNIICLDLWICHDYNHRSICCPV